MTKSFTSADVDESNKEFPRIYADRADLLDEPLDWQKQGLQQTASGYGKKLTMPYKILFNAKKYRLYCTQYSNAGSVWFIAKGRRIYVS